MELGTYCEKQTQRHVLLTTLKVTWVFERPAFRALREFF